MSAPDLLVDAIICVVFLALLSWANRLPSPELCTWARQIGVEPRFLETRRALRRRIEARLSMEDTYSRRGRR